MTQDRARKKAIRARMAASGEPYSVASRKLAATGPAGDVAAVREVIARLDNTLSAPSARMEYRVDLEHLPPERGGRRPGPAGQLFNSAAKIAWERAVPEKVRTWLRDLEGTFRLAEGLVEPAAGRYQLSYPKGSIAKMYIDGKHFMGVS